MLKKFKDLCMAGQLFYIMKELLELKAEVKELNNKLGRATENLNKELEIKDA